MSLIRLSLAALPLALLMGCGTPQQRCINAATKDLQNVEKLIKEVRGNIERGYAYATSVRNVPQFVDCTPRASSSDPDPAPSMCLIQTTQAFRVPVAIDLDQEKTKLAQLRAKRAVLAKQAQSAIAACQAQYPENTSPVSAPPAAAPSQG